MPLIIRSDFLLITQDGSLDENQYSEINKNKIQKLGIWLNGFDPIQHYSEEKINSLKNHYGINIFIMLMILIMSKNKLLNGDTGF